MSILIKINGAKFQTKTIADGLVQFDPVGNQKTSPAKIAEVILKKRINGVRDIIGTDDNFVIRSVLSTKKLAKRLNGLNIKMPPTRSWKLPVCFNDSDDWRIVLNHSALTRQQYIKAFLDCNLTVGMFGFIPGFIYLSGLDKSLHIPRKSIPGLNRSKNVLAVGGPYAGIYSIPSPSGWNIIGQLPIDVLYKNSDIPIPFGVGDHLIFEQITLSVYNDLVENGSSLKDYNA